MRKEATVRSKKLSVREKRNAKLKGQDGKLHKVVSTWKWIGKVDKGREEQEGKR